MILDNVNALINILENFSDVHATMLTLKEKGPPGLLRTHHVDKNNKVRPSHLNPMSPGGLFRGKGLNITKHKEIMKKNKVMVG